MNLHNTSLAVVLAILVQGLLSGTVLAVTTAERLSQIPAPFNAQIQSVGSNLEHNGQTLSLATFDAAVPIDDTVAFYQDLWSPEGEHGMDGIPGMVENRAGQWLIISQLQDDFQTVLQLDTTVPHRSEGFLSVMQLEVQPAVTALQTELPGMERLSTTRSRDGERVSELSVYSSTEAVEPLARQLGAYLKQQGWTLVSRQPYADSEVLLLNRQSAQLEVVVSLASGEGTLVVMNTVDDHD